MSGGRNFPPTLDFRPTVIHRDFIGLEVIINVGARQGRVVTPLRAADIEVGDLVWIPSPTGPIARCFTIGSTIPEGDDITFTDLAGREMFTTPAGNAVAVQS